MSDLEAAKGRFFVPGSFVEYSRHPKDHIVGVSECVRAVRLLTTRVYGSCAEGPSEFYVVLGSREPWQKPRYTLHVLAILGSAREAALVDHGDTSR